MNEPGQRSASVPVFPSEEMVHARQRILCDHHKAGGAVLRGAFVAGLLLYYGIKMKYTIRVSMDAVCPPRSGGAGLRLLKAFGEL